MKRHWLMLILSVALCGIVATTVADRFRVAGARVDVFFAAAVCFAVFARRERALLGAWLLGLGKDLFSGGPLGAHALLFLAAIAVIVAVRSYAYVDVAPILFILAGLAALASECVYVAVTFFRHPHFAVFPALGRLPLEAALTALLAVLLAAAISRRWRWHRPRFSLS